MELIGGQNRAYSIYLTNHILYSGQLSVHKRLRGGLFFVKSFPRTLYGKVIKKKLKEDMLSEWKKLNKPIAKK